MRYVGTKYLISAGIQWNNQQLLLFNRTVWTTQRTKYGGENYTVHGRKGWMYPDTSLTHPFSLHGPSLWRNMPRSAADEY